MNRRPRPLRSTSALVRLALIATVAFALAAEASVAAPSSFTIRTSGGYVTRIGPMDMRGASGGTLARAIAAFGQPTVVEPVADGADGCQVQWRRLRLRATFANFGLENACSPAGGRLQSATVRSTRFRTTRGVRVGTSSRTIPEKHKSAQFVGGAWWIASAIFPYGDEEAVPTIRALVRNGRVSALALYVGAAGD